MQALLGTLLLVCAPFLLLATLLADAVAARALRRHGVAGYHRVVVALARGLVAVLRVLTATRVQVHGQVPAAVAGRPCIVVANHQPPVDILLLGLCFAEHRLAFVARGGIGRHLPLVGQHLRVTGSVRVDERGPGRQLPQALQALAERVRERDGSVAIFPEGLTGWGTPTGPRPFRRAGLRRLMAALPEAALVPVVFDGCDRLVGPRSWLPRCGQQIHIRILPPLAPELGSVEARIDACERAIHGELALRQAGPGAAPHAVAAASLS